ncbi:MAG: hypothetical protein WAL59_02190 [Roseiarcus sp.]
MYDYRINARPFGRVNSNEQTAGRSRDYGITAPEIPNPPDAPSDFTFKTVAEVSTEIADRSKKRARAAVVGSIFEGFSSSAIHPIPWNRFPFFALTGLTMTNPNECPTIEEMISEAVRE